MTTFATTLPRQVCGARTRCFQQHLTSASRVTFSPRSNFHSWLRFPTIIEFAIEGPFRKKVAFPFLFKVAGVTSIGLGISAFTRRTVYCDGLAPVSASPPAPTFPQDLPPRPASTVSLYELGFGTVAGICAGVFIKKGAKAVAFFLGGVFVLLQYLGSFSVVRIDWVRMSSRFESLFYATDITGSRTPTILSLWNWIVDFLTADFQPRASFVAGFALGLRIG